MEEKNFETAKVLAERIYSDLINRYDAEDTTYAEDVAAIESLLEPYIRKPSDDDKPLFNLKADIERLVRGCMRIMHNKQDGDGKAYRELKEFVSQKVRPIGPETKSVPERCEDAYNKALNLLSRAADLFDCMGSKRVNQWMKERRCFLNKPNPFKEADIVKEDEPKQMLLPFYLELAAQGHKVVTRDGRHAKIVAEGLDGNNIAAVVQDDTSQSLHQYYIDGCYKWNGDDPLDLFILKEPESVYIHLYRDKSKGSSGSIFAKSNNKIIESDNFDFIKTIKVWI